MFDKQHVAAAATCFILLELLLKQIYYHVNEVRDCPGCFSTKNEFVLLLAANAIEYLKILKTGVKRSH